MYVRMPANLERLYDEHAQAMFAFALNLLQSEADTRDVLQDIFVKLARNPGLIERARDPRAFLLRMTHNGAIDLVRRRGARERNTEELARDWVPLFAQSANPDEQVFRRNLANALAELPDEQRVVVHLKLWEGLTFEAIAETIGITVNTAASRYRYGIDKLRDRLRPLYEEIK